MGAYSSAVGHHRCHLWVLGELFEHVGPDAVLFPTGIALEDAVPLAIAVWQFTPLGTGAQYLVDCFNEKATVLLLPCVGTRESLQKYVQFLPLMVGDSLCKHPTVVAIVTGFIKCRRGRIRHLRRSTCSVPLQFAICTHKTCANVKTSASLNSKESPKPLSALAANNTLHAPSQIVAVPENTASSRVWHDQSCADCQILQRT